MTREEAEKAIKAMPCIFEALVTSFPGFGIRLSFVELSDAKSSDLRAIADILDQVGKEGVNP